MLLLGVTGLLAHEGRVVGAGPTDPKTRSDWEKAGGRSYSFIIPHADGSKTYIPFNRFDPVAGPIGLAADLDYLERLDDVATQSKHETLMTALYLTAMHSVTDKMYLDNFERLFEAVTNASEAENEIGRYMRNLIVPFGALLRSPLGGDPYVREANGIADQIMSNMPGLSEKLPPKRDAWGDPIPHENPWWSTKGNSVADQELQRLALEQKVDIGPPKSTWSGKVDLRDLTMKDGTSAWEKYQELARQPMPGMPTLKAQAERLIESKGYQSLVDGDEQTKGTKAYRLLGLIKDYREAARAELLRDPNVRQAVYQRRVDVRNALAAKHPNPTNANKVSKTLENLGNAFGIDLHSASGAAAPQSTPSPLPPGSKLQ